MAREPINAGASTLAAMSDNVAKMGALRQQALAQTSESLNNAAKHLQEWQKGYDERKRAKWVQDMETAVQSVSQPVKKAGASGSVKLDKKVIGRVDIAKNARFKTIVVRQDA